MTTSRDYPERPPFDAELRGATILGVNLYGNVYNDSRKRFEDGEDIHTSHVQEVWRATPAGHIVRTKTGTVYRVEFLDENYAFKQLREMVKAKVYE